MTRDALIRAAPAPSRSSLCDLEDAVLAVAEDDQLGGLAADDLAAQLRADGAACAGHQHAPAAEQRGDLRRVGLHRLTAQQILDLHVAKLADAGRTAQQLIHPGNDAGAHAGLLADVHDLAHGRSPEALGMAMITWST